MHKLVRALAAGGAAVALTVSLAACGGTVADPGAGSGSGGEGGGAEISVDTARGPVTLPKPAAKVVSLEWVYTEELMSLGVTPVGVADSKSYASWLTAEGTALPEGIQDVGKRQEPSLEQIKALAPDLIVASEDRVKSNYEALKGIAPVMSFDYTVKPQLETMKKNFTALGAAVGKQEKAAEVLGQLDAKAADVKARLEQAGKGGAEYAIGQAFTAQGAPSVRMLGNEAIAPQILGLAGLRNTWQGQQDAWGMTTVGVEGLSQVPATASFVYVAQAQDDPFSGALAGNPLWLNLPFVKDGRTAALDPGTWIFGGPASAMKLLDETAKALQV